MAIGLRLGQRLLGGRHGHAPDGSGGHLVRPALCEVVGAIYPIWTPALSHE